MSAEPPPFVSAFERTLLCVVLAPNNMSSSVGEGALEVSTAPDVFFFAVPHGPAQGNAPLTPLQLAVIAAEEKRFNFAPLYLNKPKTYAAQWLRTLYDQLQSVFGAKKGDSDSDDDDDDDEEDEYDSADDDDEDDGADDDEEDDFAEGDKISVPLNKKRKVLPPVLEKPAYQLPVTTSLSPEFFTDEYNFLKIKSPGGEVFQLHKPPAVMTQEKDRPLTLIVQYFNPVDAE
jgi:hypothetical protein